jgi:hypothetical protein
MSESTKMLTQEEIDAMVAESIAKKPTLPHANKSHDPVSPKAEVTHSPSSPKAPPIEAMPAVSKSTISSTVQGREPETFAGARETSSVDAKMAELSSRIVELETSVRRIEDIRSQVRVIAEALKNTPGYNIHNTFNCSHCGSDGVIAVKVWCTECGQSHWLGWWPEEE